MSEDKQWKYIVVLEIIVNEESNPSLWGWRALLDLAPEEKVTVLAESLSDAEYNMKESD